MNVIANFIKRIVPVVINFPGFKFVEPLGAVLRALSYSFYYLAWYHKNNIRDCLIETQKPFGHDNRFAVYEKLAEKLGLGAIPIRYLEFGVHKGASIKWWLEANKHPESRFSGYDSFQGLPEDWGKVPKGEFSTGGAVPEVNDTRCAFVKGLFQDTLKHTEIAPSKALNVIHLDADLYSSTLYVLTSLNNSLKKGDILIFDEFAYVSDEFRAFLDYQAATFRQLRPLYAVNSGDVIAFEFS